MPVDASPYAHQQPQPNLLDQIRQLGGAADTLGNIEVGKGMQQAIQPDGSVDRNILAQHLKGTVAGSMKATPAMQALEALRSAGYSTDEQGLRTLMAKSAYITSAIAPLVQRNPDGSLKPVTQAQVLKSAASMLKDADKYGIKVPEIMKSVTGLQDMTDAQRAEALHGQLLQGQTAGRAFEALLPRTADVDTGAGSSRVNAGTQVAPNTFDATRDVPPGTPTVDDRRTLPDGTRNPNFGQPMLVGPGGTGGGRVTVKPMGAPDSPPGNGTVVSRTTTDPRTGRPISERAHDAIRERGQPGAPSAVPMAPLPTPAGPPMAPLPPAAPAPAARATTGPRAQAAPIPAGLTPGATAQLQQASEAYSKDLLGSREYQERITPLREAIPRLERLGKRGTGPGAETYNDVKSFAQTWGLPIPKADALKDFAEAKKYLTQNAVALAPPGTNIPSVTAAFEANPNVGQPNQAAVYLAKSMLTLARLKQASITAFAQEVEAGRVQPNQYAEWSSRWIGKQDPKAFGADLWTKEDREKLAKTHKPGTPQAAKFRASVDEARRLGLLGDVERPEQK